MGRKEAILQLREVLLNRRDALRKALAGDLDALRELRNHPGGDAIDVALDSAHGEISSQLAELESRELALIEKALERMRNGTYGLCEMTGKPIPLARLRALPYAILCIEAQRQIEESGETPDSIPSWGRILDSSANDQTVPFNNIKMR